MASPLSFGDCFLICKLCWKLAQAFTSGRNSAPAEFREVENQLYSLSAALDGLQNVRGNDVATSHAEKKIDDRWSTVDKILLNCRETLEHLEAVVKKYAEVDQVRDMSLPRIKRWSGDISRNWKKVAWTKEKGDLTALRSQIAAHTNSLSLVLATITNSQTGRIKNQVEQSSKMLREIYEWYKENLEGTATAVLQEKRPAAEWTTTTPPSPHFELHVHTTQGLQLVCPRVSLNTHVLLADDTTQRQEPFPNPFICCCCQPQGSLGGHASSVKAFQVTHLTFPARIGGPEMQWTVEKLVDTSVSRLVSIRIKRVPASFVAEFEESFIRPLVLRAAQEEVLQGGDGSMTVYLQPGTEAADPCILSIAADLDKVQPLVDSVTFANGQRSYRRECVQSVSMLQYSSLVRQTVGSAHSSIPFLKPLPHGEICITFEQADDDTQGPDDVMQVLVLLKHDTSPKLNQGNATLKLENVLCDSFSSSPENDGTGFRPMDVTFQLTTAKAAAELHQHVEEMRMELFVLKLVRPEEGEEDILHLQATHVQIENEVFIPAAELTILRHAESGKSRMIIATRDKCIILSQSLPYDFFSPPDHATDTGAVEKSSPAPTWLVQLEEGGRRRVYRFECGLRGLRFRNAQSNRALELARQAISGGLPYRPA
ncbi:hypothetical protein MAPG_00101 [Magnaporthiopsis poae ATCC 64411]|uniref:NACHT-NTPase and P-loop NTPases N-terminal domain-containing protein n=1 Tax=Magnaporthiopsis poae (strain ATCC 64411 / 73-15) TaxID=644358 RepID=A0A0C4DK39_MAGP6|nr:hypothetical protein MAPG_00101 [Magnaporthiopsis poae ATCC 64411]